MKQSSCPPLKTGARWNHKEETVQAGRQFGRNLFLLYLPTALCFLVINITNDRILTKLSQHGLIYGRDPDAAVNFDKTIRFFLVPLKTLVFFVCTMILIVHLVPAFKRIFALFKQQSWMRCLLPFLICFALTFNYTLVAFGRSYARISTDPFNQNVDQLYRRLLIPGLANLYHLDGFLYVFFYWFLVLVTILALRLYFIEQGAELSLLHEVSILTIGSFVSAWQCTGYPEIVVLLLGLIALIEFNRDVGVTMKQTAAFSLALMTHEACGIIVFVPMILFLYGRKAWLPNATVAIMYAGAVLANFSFNLSTPFKVQTIVSGMPAQEQFRRWPSHVVLGAAFSFKFLWLIVPIGLYFLYKRQPRVAFFGLGGFLLAFASTYIGIDYTRLVAFATIPMLLCYLEFRRNFSARIINAVMAANLIVPSFFVAGNSGIVTFRGLYSLAFAWLVRFHSSTG